LRAPRAAAAHLFRGWADDCLEATRMALLAMRAHRMRTALTMLGIVIGIASLVLVVALGAGGKAKVIESMQGLGTNTLDIMAGRNWGDENATRFNTLTARDAAAILAQGYVDSVTPYLTSPQSVRVGNLSVSAQLGGVGEQYFRVHGMEILAGTAFSAVDVRALSQVAVIDDITRNRLFGKESSVVGKVILIGTMPCRVIGVSGVRQDNGNALHVYVPYTTALGRLLGPRGLSQITARIADQAPSVLAQSAIEKLLVRRHGTQDFYLYNLDTFRKSVESSVKTLSALISSIALISLLVGGIGVMNIMLVSVTERTREIGVRAAVGARRVDILRQFLIEAVLVCLLGGALGILIALIGGWVFNELVGQFHLIFSTASMLLAVGVSTVIGVVFGYLPARNAANLDPIEALARE
jgi:macrolide transport system ATP-binding/permease protein